MRSRSPLWDYQEMRLLPERNSQLRRPLIMTDAINALVHTLIPTREAQACSQQPMPDLYRTFDAGKGWQKLPYNAAFDPRTTCISTSLKTPLIIWAGTAASGVLVTRDGGKTWSQGRGHSN